MKKKIIKLVIYQTSLVAMIATGVKIKICDNKSKQYTKNVEAFKKSFKKDDFLVAAHRGYSSLAVENSLESIEIANDSKYVDYIEIDARLTKDNKLVLSHDDEVITTYHKSLKISDESLKTLNEKSFCHLNGSLKLKMNNLFNTTNGDIITSRAKEIDSSSYNIITLKDGILACQNKKVLLDLKFDNNTKDYVDELVKQLKDVDTKNIMFQSSDLISLLYLKKMKPEYNCLAILKKEEDLDYIELFDNVGIRKNLVSKKLVNNLLEEKKKIAIWTLNEPEEIKTVVNKLGPNYKDVIYISDYPDVVATHLNENEKKLAKVKD